MILFPRKSGQHKKLDSSAEDVKAATEDKVVKKVSAILPIPTGTGLEFGIKEVSTSDLPKGEEAAYRKLRDLRAESRYAGMREKRAKAKAEAEDAKKK